MNTSQKASKGSVGVESFQGRLRLPRQLYDGKQKYLTLGLDDSRENRVVADAKVREIQQDIFKDLLVPGSFDRTLANWLSTDHSNI